MNGGIINSVTRLHLVGCFHWNSNIHFPITLSRTVLDYPNLSMVKRPECKLLAAVLYTFGHVWVRQHTFRRSVRWDSRSSLRVIYMGGPCKALDPLFWLSHVLNTHLVLGLFVWQMFTLRFRVTNQICNTLEGVSTALKQTQLLLTF